MIRESFMSSELKIEEQLKKCKTKKERLMVRRERADSAPCHLNHYREIAVQQRLIVHTQEL